MKIGKILAISVAFGLASASVASATVVGVDMFGGGKGKKGTFSLNSIGDGEMVGARMGFNNKKFKMKVVGGEKGQEVELDDFDSFKAKVKKKGVGTQAFYKAFPKTGYVEVDFMVDGEKKTHRMRFGNMSKSMFKGGGLEKIAGMHYEHGGGSGGNHGGSGGNHGGSGGNHGGSGGDTTPSVVPLPAALPLMLGGLFGLGMVGRRRKA